MYIVSRIIMHTNKIAYNFVDVIPKGYVTDDPIPRVVDYSHPDHETIITHAIEMIDFFDHCDAQHPEPAKRYEYLFDKNLKPS